MRCNWSKVFKCGKVGPVRQSSKSIRPGLFVEVDSLICTTERNLEERQMKHGDFTGVDDNHVCKRLTRYGRVSNRFTRNGRN